MGKGLKILKINKYYFIMGGSERYYFELTKVLKSRGHDVIPFAMKHPSNFDSEYSRYFVDQIEFNYGSPLQKLIKTPQIAGRIIYSLHSKTRLEQLIDACKPDIAHLHMIDHQLSPSILHVLKKHDIPVVQTVHQYKLVCPNYRLYIAEKGQICEKCVKGSALHPIIEKCHKGSRFASTLIALESFTHRKMKIYDIIDKFHVPSGFMGKKLAEGGIPQDKIFNMFYTINLDDYPFSNVFDDYFIYYGRLSHEKGILTLLKAMDAFRSSRLLVVGDGPQRPELEQYVAQNGLSNVKFMGNKSKDELKNLVSRAQFVVVPSEWYDNSPLVIYESFSMGRPVIGADIGGISELVDHEENGFLFIPGDVVDLKDKMNHLLHNPKLMRNFGRNGRDKAEREFSPDPHYEKMYQLYLDLMK